MSPRFTRLNLIKLGRLMDMLYKPSEIAEEIGVTMETVYRSYLPGGCPFERDKAGNYWIHGISFAEWVRSVTARKEMNRLADGQAWCLRCRKAVALVKPRQRFKGRYVVIYQGKCDSCGAKVNRAYSAAEDPGKEKEG
jgi:hypothetical protein